MARMNRIVAYWAPVNSLARWASLFLLYIVIGSKVLEKDSDGAEQKP